MSLTLSLSKIFYAVAFVLFLVAALGVGEVLTLGTVSLGLASLAAGLFTS